MPTTLRTDTEDGVRIITLSRAAEYNTIIPALREDLAAAIDEADHDRAVHVMLLRAEGPAFCAGYNLASTANQAAASAAEQEGARPAWDSVQDMGMMSRNVDAFMKLWYARKPTIAGVQGWCIGGGTDMVLCADIIVAGEGATFGYPPSRVWGTPTTAMWVYRMGLE
ncbi:MAG: enoyl-CoA hydratase-related protein, partial [Tepidiformaceae bacterium]